LFLVFGLFLSANAFANFEQVATFPGAGGEGIFQESLGLSNATGLAVNETGIGGVPAGTLYAASYSNGYIVRYGPKGEFLGEWKRPGISQGIAIDQVTGNVYVSTDAAEGNSIFVYSADGSELITSFGEKGAFEETIDEGSEKIHNTSPSGIAVDDSGTVYVSDIAHNFANRVMRFEPAVPGDYEHYVYAGRASDIAPSPNTITKYIALDDAGNLYAAVEDAISLYAPGEPSAPKCRFLVPNGGLTGLTVDPASGEVFYYTGSTRSKIHRLAACDSQDKFIEEEAISFAPAITGNHAIYAMAVNPFLKYETTRPASVLYAANPNSAVELNGETLRGLGYIFAPQEAQEPLPPAIESESVSQVTSTSARLGALINPKGSETRFAFQYISNAAYQANEPTQRFAGAAEVPIGGAVLGSGQVPLNAASSVFGLTPDSTYHYRVVATSHCEAADPTAICEAVGQDQMFSTYPAGGSLLPDGRVWEMVSPAQKGGEVIPGNFGETGLGGSCIVCLPGLSKPTMPMQAAPDGESVLYMGQPFSSGLAAATDEYLAGRSTAGWTSQSISTPTTTGRWEAFSTNLSKGILYQVDPALSPEAPSRGGVAFANLYLVEQGGTPQPLVTAEPPSRDPGEPSGVGSQFRLNYAGANSGTPASPAFAHVIFAANDALTGEVPGIAPPAPPLVKATQYCFESNCNLYEWSGGELHLVNVLPGNAAAAGESVIGSGRLLQAGGVEFEAPDVSNAISTDGSRIFWTSRATGQVYARLDGTETLEVPGPGTCKTSVARQNRTCFITASTDGAEVLLSNGEIYELNESAGAFEGAVDLTGGLGGFEGILGASADLSRVYFVDTAALTPEAETNANREFAEPGAANLYVYAAGEVRFIGALLKGDNEFGGPQPRYGAWNAAPSDRTAQVTPDGSFLAFMTRARLNGYDNVRAGGGNCGHSASPACFEVYEYSLSTGTLTCASCNPTGVRPSGPSSLSLLKPGGEGPPFAQPANLTSAGHGRLFFESQDVLAAQDTNGSIQDVYGWEPEGVGTCERASGCVSLISGGHGANDSMFLDSTPSGDDVFFITRDRLLPRDKDQLLDLYDARVGGGIAEEEEARCAGEACRAPISISPVQPNPGSSAFSGPGNPKPRQSCKRGLHKKAGKCVKTKTKKKHVRKGKKRKAHNRAAHNYRGGAK
jgi:sugar lactone lactonase YvrE